MLEVNCHWHVSGDEKILFLEAMQKFGIIDSKTSGIDLTIKNNKTAINCNNKTFWCDFNDTWHQNILYTVKYESSPLARAINIRQNNKILDATAGWGRDSFTLVTLGAQVTAVEKQPLVALMLYWSARQIKQLSVINSNHKDIIGQEPWDAIYFDFMFEKPNRKAKSNQGIEFLSDLSEQDPLTMETWAKAIKNSKRVIFKRSKNAKLPIITRKPNHTIEAKTVCFDVFIGEIK